MISAKSILQIGTQAGLNARSVVRLGPTTGEESGPDLSPIDLTTPELDARVAYSGPEHNYIDADDNIILSARNEWPLEYNGGVVVGRHEPERASQNYLLDSSFLSISDTGSTPATSWTHSQSSGISVVPAARGDYATAQGNPSWTATGVYSEGGSDTPWLAEEMDQGGASNWTIVLRNFTNPDTAQIRYYIMRALSGGATNYLYGKAPAVPAGDYVASMIHRITDTNLECRAAQVEPGTLPTSPIYNLGEEQAMRAESSVTVTNPGGASGITVHYSDDTTTAISFGSANSVSIPLASKAWAVRYITQITFEV